MAQVEIILTDASVDVNDETITIENGSLTFVEGQGETTVRSASNGGRPVIVPTVDIGTMIGKIKFDTPSSIQSMNFFRDVKARPIASNVVRVSGTDAAGNRLGRTLTAASLMSDPEKAIQTDGKFTVDFEGAPLVVS